MSGTNSEEVMALADVYAESLLSTAAGAGQEVADALTELVESMRGDADLAMFLTAADFDEDRRRELLEQLFRGKMNDLLLNLLGVLNNRGRSDLLPAVAECVEQRMRELHNQQEIVVETAVALTDDLRSAIKQDLGQALGKEVVLAEKVRPELIGGVVIRVGDMQIDGSVNAGIRLMRDRLLERAGEEVTKAEQYYVV